jgi:hypothetical protein
MDFWRRSVPISRKDKIRNNVVKGKMNVTRSLLDDVKIKQLQWYGQSKGWGRGDCQKGTGMATVRGKETRQTETYRAKGIRGMMGEKGLQEEDWTDRNNWRGKIA